MLWLTKTRMITTLTPWILLQAFVHNTKVLEKIIHFIYLIHFSALSTSISRIIGTWKNYLWMMNWKVEGNSRGTTATRLATASRDWGQSQKLQFRILLALTNFYLGTSRVQATNITDDQTWLIYMHQRQRKHCWCHYSKSFVTKKVLKHSTTSKHKNSSVCGFLHDAPCIRIS